MDYFLERYKLPKSTQEENKNLKMFVTTEEILKSNNCPSNGSSVSPKEAGPKEDHIKTHHNDITQD